MGQTHYPLKAESLRAASLSNLDKFSIIFWDFPMFYKIFFSLQVKRWPIITTYTYDIYKLPHNLPHDLRLLDLKTFRTLGN